MVLMTLLIILRDLDNTTRTIPATRFSSDRMGVSCQNDEVGHVCINHIWEYLHVEII